MAPMEISAKVREARRAKRLTQAQAAILAGISPSSLSLVERTGHVTPKIMAALATVLEFPVQELAR